MGLMIDLLPSAGPALVVGGGSVASRKVRNLVESQFEVVVVAPEVAEEIRLAPQVTVFERLFEPTDIDLRPFGVVFACTNDRATNALVGRLARTLGIPVVVADAQAESTFFTPATIRDGDLAVAVSTGGADPSLARRIREQIVASLGPNWGSIAGAARREREERLALRHPESTDEAT